jgi:hypothetical protein
MVWPGIRDEGQGMFSKYFERGLAVIPIVPNSKVPVSEAEGYQRWSHERQPQELIEEWDTKFKQSDGYGVGIVMGTISNLCTVDIDTLRPDIIAECPVSPIVRRGNPKRYGALLFRHNPNIPNKPFKVHELIGGELVKHEVDILTNGKYLLVPPSINPDSRTPYIWLTPDTLENFSADDLPLLLPEHIDRIERKFETLKLSESSRSALALGVQQVSGRNDYLKNIVWAKRLNNESEEEIVESVYQIDLCKHDVPLFSDPTEGYASEGIEGARLNAWKFVTRVTKSFIERKAGPAPRIRLPEISLSGPREIKRWEPMPIPEPQGLVREMRDLILKSSKYSQPGLAMAGALSICSVLIANRFRMDDTWPNVYVLAIAPTGTGKQFPINAAVKLLVEDHDTRLFGKEQVLSGQALLKGLDQQRERLDIIDECSQLFHMISHGGVFQADVLPLMLKLYSCSNTLFVGPESLKSDPIRLFHPCVSSLMLTNQEDFKLSVTRNFLTGGFLPRCLPFIEEARGPRQVGSKWDEALAESIGERIEAIVSSDILMDADPGKKRKNLLCPKPSPKNVAQSDASRRRFHEFDSEIDAETERPNLPELRRHMLSRAVQNATKLALIHGSLSHGMVDEQDASWAISTVKALIHNCEPLYEKIMAATPAEAATIGVIDIVKKAGRMSEAEFYAATRVLTKTQRNEAVQAAQIEGRIRVVVDKSSRQYEAL